MVRKLFFFALVALVGFACFELGQRGARAYERMITERVATRLDVLGYGWARVQADGLRLSVYGHAPDTFARDLAIEAVRGDAPLARVVSYATATLAPPEHRDPVRVELLRDERGVTLTGQTASRAMREQLNAALVRDGPELRVEDLTGIQAALPPRGWGPEIGVASLAASRLPSAYVVMEPGRVTIDGQAADEADRKALTQALLERAGERVSLVLRIRIPARVIAPFAFSASKDASGGIRLERCASRSYEEQAALLERLKTAGVENLAEACPVGLGGPGGDWPAAVAAGLDVLGALRAGRIDIEYRDARLVGAPPTAPEAFEQALAGFKDALPEGFAAAGELRADDIATRTAIARERFWMQLRRTPQGLVLAGQVADEAARLAMETAARALYGAEGIESSLSVVDAAPPAGWQGAGLRLIGYVHELTEGEARLAGHRASLRGTVPQPALARELHHRIETELPDYEVSTAFRVDLPTALAQYPLPPLRCAAELNSANRQPAIDFAPGSAVIVKDSLPALDRMAALLSRCAGGSITIGGHTDSQGREDLNRRLSEARAEAVMRALIERGVPPARIVARGYGESMPVASNETEPGRAQNRRIEFEPAG